MSSPADSHVETDLGVHPDDISLENDDSSNSDRGEIFDDNDSLFSVNTIDSAEDQDLTCNLGAQASVQTIQTWPTTLAKNDQVPQKSPEILHPAPSSKNTPPPPKYEPGDYPIDDSHSPINFRQNHKLLTHQSTKKASMATTCLARNGHSAQPSGFPLSLKVFDYINDNQHHACYDSHRANMSTVMPPTHVGVDSTCVGNS